MAKKIIAANWKEHPQSFSAAAALFRATAKAQRSGFDAIVCPPAIYLRELGRIGKRYSEISLGAQDVFYEDTGPFTGAVGPAMLRSLGVKYAIIGHSERRKWFGETDAMISKKVAAAMAGGLRVILCVGEPAAVRKRGKNAAEAFIRAQLQKDLEGVRGEKEDLLVAYEPIWAIGSGKNDNPDDARAVAAFIKKAVRAAAPGMKVRVLYGGSVDGSDIRSYLGSKEIDGALVGGASVKVETLKKLFYQK